MPESTPKPAAKPARPLNRWGLGTLTVLQTALLAVIVIALNYVSVHQHSTLDLSRTRDYSLSPATRNYLASDSVRDRAKPIRWIMSYRRSAPFHDRVRALAEEYARHSNGRIELEVVDPLRSPDRMQEVATAYGLSMMRDLIIIDARLDDSPPVAEDANRIKTLNPHVRLVLAEEMAVFTTLDGQRRISGFQGEDVLTSSLVAAIEGRSKKMALLADKGRLEAGEGFSPHQALEDTLRFQNVQIPELHLSEIADIPEEVDGILLVAPKYDLTDDEVAVLERYWNRPRAAILVMLGPGNTPPKLRAFLRGNGVTPRADRVIARGKNGLATRARGVFTKGVDFTRDLAGQTTEFGGASSSLEVREDAPELQTRRIQPLGLIEVSAGFWGETNFGDGHETFNEMEDHAPPLYLAAGVIRGAESDDRFAAESSRMLVISNTDFLDPRHHRAENLDFLASSVNWLVGREQLAGIGPRSLDMYKLPLLDAQVSFINRVNLFFLPAFILVIGASVWSSRRV
jgi:hypothetical protein